MYTTYTDLQNGIANWLNRSDVGSLLTGWIALAEAHMNRELRMQQMLTRVTLTLSSALISTPADWLETKSVTYMSNPPRPLEFLTEDQLVRKNVEALTTVEYYTMEGSQLRVLGAPSGSPAPTVQMIYYAAIPALSGSVASNWVLAKHPDLYLFLAMYYGNIFLRDDTAAAQALTAYMTARDAALAADSRARVSTTPKTRVQVF